MTKVGNTMRRAFFRVAGVLSIAAVVVAGCGESRSSLDAGSKADGGGSAGATGSGGTSGSGGNTGGSGGFRLDGGFDVNLDGLSLDGVRLDLGGLDLGLPVCPASAMSGGACTASEGACQSGGVACLCFNSKWTCTN